MDILIILSLAIGLYTIIIFNRLVKLRQQVKTAWSDIDVQLKRRHDLIPKLIDAVRQYANYEQATLTVITELRQRSEHTPKVSDRSTLEGSLQKHIQQLVLLAEDYPELKANESFLDLQHQLSEVEQHLQYARRYYNGSVRDLNTRIESFPDLLVAQAMELECAEYFDYEEIS